MLQSHEYVVHLSNTVKSMHLLPGRLRLKSEPLRGDFQNAALVERLLGTIKGVHKASVNIVTGSITIHFDQDQTTGHAIINFLINEQWIDNVLPFPGRKTNSPLSAHRSEVSAVAPLETKPQMVRKPTSQLMNKIAITTVKLVLPILIERYIGKSASRFVSSIL